MLRSATLDSPLGPLLAVAADTGIVLLEFHEPGRLEPQLAGLARHFPASPEPGAHPHLAQLQSELDEYFRGRRRQFTVPLQAPGSVFQMRVWAALQGIPYGETRAYRELALELGDAQASRAVGTANGQNRLAILIPCHRVVNTGGTLGGYGGGLWRKQWLLDLEGGQGRML